SEKKLESKLNLSWGPGGGDASNRAQIHRGAGLPEMRGDGEIAHVAMASPALRPAESEVLSDLEIHVPKSRTEQNILTRVAEREVRRQGEGAGIEPMLDAPHGGR